MSEDVGAIVFLWQAFLAERVTADPSMILKPEFDVAAYLQRQLSRPHTYAWLLEDEATAQIVGCLLIYFYDEAPPPGLPEDLRAEYEMDNPFQPRRVGSVLGLYVQPEHRQPEAIQQLATAGLQMAEAMQVTDVDILVSREQTGVHALLERGGFTRSAVQFTRHYALDPSAERINLHPTHPELDLPDLPSPSALPLRHPDFRDLVRNPQGEPVFLLPLTDGMGEVLRDSHGLPIYPQPLLDAQTGLPIFDDAGEVVICPPVYDEAGRILEHRGIPQFCPPMLEMVAGQLQMQRSTDGSYHFCEVERDREGNLVRSPDGAPVFKMSPLVRSGV